MTTMGVKTTLVCSVIGNSNVQGVKLSSVTQAVLATLCNVPKVSSSASLRKEEEKTLRWSCVSGKRDRQSGGAEKGCLWWRWGYKREDAPPIPLSHIFSLTIPREPIIVYMILE